MIHPTYLARCKDCQTPTAGLRTRGVPTPPLGWCNHCGRFTDWDWNTLLDGLVPCDFGLRSVTWTGSRVEGWIQA